MQKHPLLSVKEAAEMLRLDERTVRERLINGQLKGEKKSVGLREKWFVFSGSVESALAKQYTPPTDEEINSSAVTVESSSLESEDGHERDATESPNNGDWIDANRDKVKVLAEEIVKPLMERIEAQALILGEQRKTIADQDRQLRLLPDLERKADEHRKELELKHVENEALKKQIDAMALKQEADEKALAELKAAAAKSWWSKFFAK